MAGAKNTLSAIERADLAAAFISIGPDQPTLCEGWQTQDLLTHLIIRERRPDAALGIVVPALKSWREKIEQNFKKTSYSELVQLFASGPGALSPFAVPGIDNLANLIEFVIHHEDVRRAQPNWSPRNISPELALELKNRLPKFALLALRKLPLGVLMVSSSGVQTWLKRGSTAVELHGDPIEVLLYISGRQQQANVSLHGSPAAIATFERMKFGF